MVKYTNSHLIPSDAADIVTAPGRNPSSGSTADGLAAGASRVQPKVLRAIITVEMEACDYVEAADHQKQLVAALAVIHRDYPSAWLTLGGRHPRGDDQAGRRPRLLRQSGRLNEYE